METNHETVFAEQMRPLLAKYYTYPEASAETEVELDLTLAQFTKTVVDDRMSAGRKEGHRGWWGLGLSTHRIVELLNSAIAAERWDSAVAYSAILHARKVLSKTT